MTKVDAGFFSFTEILNGNHHGYNEWHMLDHMPSKFPIAGIAHAQRWVSSPRCREARMVSGPMLDPIHYITLYYLGEPIQKTIEEFIDPTESSQPGRWFEDRQAPLGGAFLLRHTLASEHAKVSGECVAARPNKGVFIAVFEITDAGGRDAYWKWLEEHHRRLCDLPGVAGAWAFATDPSVSVGNENTYANFTIPFDGGVSVIYCDDDPVEVTKRIVELGDKYPGTSPARSLFAGPLEAINPWQWSWFD